MYDRLDWNFCAMGGIYSAEMQAGEYGSLGTFVVTGPSATLPSEIPHFPDYSIVSCSVAPLSFSGIPPFLSFPVFQAASSQLLSLSSPPFIMQKSWAPELVYWVTKEERNPLKGYWQLTELMLEGSEWKAPVIFSGLACLENPYHKMKRSLWNQRGTVVLRILYKIRLHKQQKRYSSFIEQFSKI